MDSTELDDRDVTLLRHLAEGMSASQIAAYLGESPRQVQRDVQAMRSRLGAVTNVHAVAVAVRRGLI